MRPEKALFHVPESFSQDPELVAVEGRSSMAKHCEPFPGKRVVLVTVSTDYFDMFTNWLSSAKRFLHATEHLHMIAEDEEVVAPLEAFLKGQEFDYSVASPQAPSALLSLQPPYNSSGYGNVVWERPKHIVSLLRVGCSVLYVDIDTVWMKDPFPEIEAAGSADLYIADDSPPPEGKILRNFCTCFMYFHPAGAAVSLLENWSAKATGKFNQKIFNHVMKDAVEAHTAPKVGVLPVTQFPPGNVVLKPGASLLLEDSPSDPAVYHANWRMGNTDKVHFFEVLGMWNPAPRAN